MLKILSRNCLTSHLMNKYCPNSNTEGLYLIRKIKSHRQWMSSKTPISKSGLAQPASIEHLDHSIDPLPYSKEDVLIQSQENPSAVIPRRKRKTEIIRMDPSEYKNAAIGVKLVSLLERRGEANLTLKHLSPDGERDTVEILCFIQQDIDLRPSALKRVMRSIDIEAELKLQAYNPKRVSVLGPDLSAAHFLVARKGRIRFLNQTEWISTYRKDALTVEDERDLPTMRLDLCTMPINYDPNYRVEAIDASGVNLHYEGLANLDNLNHVTWIKLQNSPLFNDWGLDRLIGMFCETVEYLDLSGCHNITDRGLAALWRMKNLKTLILNDLQHIDKLEIVCAHLEDLLPNLTCIGVDYEKKIEEVKNKTANMEKDYKDKLAALEANTIDVEPRLIDSKESTQTNR